VKEKKDWLRDILSDMFGGAAWDVVKRFLPIGLSVGGIVWAYFQNHPQLVWQIVLLVAVGINTFAVLHLIRRQNWFIRLLLDQAQEQQAALHKDSSPLAELGSRPGRVDPLEQELSEVFQITDRNFDDTSDPQRIGVQFTNQGSDVIRITKIRYSDKVNGLPASALDKRYRKTDRGRILISFDQNRAEVLPGQSFLVEIRLEQQWKREQILSLSGECGYLTLPLNVH
jgi:hypothetical protein